jgi:hypothetical protein
MASDRVSFLRKIPSKPIIIRIIVESGCLMGDKIIGGAMINTA